MRTFKHVGKLKNSGSKVLVVFRTIPGESNSALVIQTSTLPDIYHDSIMSLVDSDQGQDAWEFGEAMYHHHFPDGRAMLLAMQQDGRLQKVPTDSVIMTPTVDSQIQLDQLNILIAEQKNMAVDELCTLVSGAKPEDKDRVKNLDKVNAEARAAQQQQAAVFQEDPGPTDPIERAAWLRQKSSDLYREAIQLRKQADELDPPPKKAATAKKKADVESSTAEEPVTAEETTDQA